MHNTMIRGYDRQEKGKQSFSTLRRLVNATANKGKKRTKVADLASLHLGSSRRILFPRAYRKPIRRASLVQYGTSVCDGDV